MKCTIISQPSNYVPCREKLWKYQEHIDSSLTGQPFIGKVGKTRKGEMLMPIHASVSSVTPSPPPPAPRPPHPNQFNPHFLPFEFATKFNPDTVHVVPFYPKSNFWIYAHKCWISWSGYLQPWQTIFIRVFLHVRIYHLAWFLKSMCRAGVNIILCTFI